MPDYSHEIAWGADAGRRIVGIDEAGRGPWAGPVVAAAVWLRAKSLPAGLLNRLDDSKRLSRARREWLFCQLYALPATDAAIGVGQASVAEIDSLNILQASLAAMARAVEALGFQPDAALVDGNRPPVLSCESETLVKGDSKSLSIAAASIVAKVIRDRQMADLASHFPGYGWERNQGYGTAEHQAALDRLGVTPEHRRSFRPIRERLT